MAVHNGEAVGVHDAAEVDSDVAAEIQCAEAAVWDEAVGVYGVVEAAASDVAVDVQCVLAATHVAVEVDRFESTEVEECCKTTMVVL